MYSKNVDDEAQPVDAGRDIELLCDLPTVPHNVSWQFIPADSSLATKSPTSSRFEVCPLSYFCNILLIHNFSIIKWQQYLTNIFYYIHLLK